MLLIAFDPRFEKAKHILKKLESQNFLVKNMASNQTPSLIGNSNNSSRAATPQAGNSKNSSRSATPNLASAASSIINNDNVVNSNNNTTNINNNQSSTPTLPPSTRDPVTLFPQEISEKLSLLRQETLLRSTENDPRHDHPQLPISGIVYAWILSLGYSTACQAPKGPTDAPAAPRHEEFAKVAEGSTFSLSSLVTKFSKAVDSASGWLASAPGNFMKSVEQWDAIFRAEIPRSPIVNYLHPSAPRVSFPEANNACYDDPDLRLYSYFAYEELQAKVCQLDVVKKMIAEKKLPPNEDDLYVSVNLTSLFQISRKQAAMIEEPTAHLFPNNTKPNFSIPFHFDERHGGYFWVMQIFVPDLLRPLAHYVPSQLIRFRLGASKTQGIPSLDWVLITRYPALILGWMTITPCDRSYKNDERLPRTPLSSPLPPFAPAPSLQLQTTSSTRNTPALAPSSDPPSHTLAPLPGPKVQLGAASSGPLPHSAPTTVPLPAHSPDPAMQQVQQMIQSLAATVNNLQQQIVSNNQPPVASSPVAPQPSSGSGLTNELLLSTIESQRQHTEFQRHVLMYGHNTIHGYLESVANKFGLNPLRLHAYECETLNGEFSSIRDPRIKTPRDVFTKIHQSVTVDRSSKASFSPKSSNSSGVVTLPFDEACYVDLLMSVGLKLFEIIEQPPRSVDACCSELKDLLKFLYEHLYEHLFAEESRDSSSKSKDTRLYPNTSAPVTHRINRAILRHQNLPPRVDPEFLADFLHRNGSNPTFRTKLEEIRSMPMYVLKPRLEPHSAASTTLTGELSHLMAPTTMTTLTQEIAKSRRSPPQSNSFSPPVQRPDEAHVLSPMTGTYQSSPSSPFVAQNTYPPQAVRAPSLMAEISSLAPRLDSVEPNYFANPCAPASPARSSGTMFGHADSDNRCACVAVAAALKATIATFSCKKNLSKYAAEFLRSSDLVHLSDLVAKTLGVDPQAPHDAATLLERFLEGPTEFADGVRFGEVFKCGWYSANRQLLADEVYPRAALIFHDSHDSEFGHWTFLIPSKDPWCRGSFDELDLDGLKGRYHVITEDPDFPESFFLWHAPLLGLGRADNKCDACGKFRTSHTNSNLARSCSRCQKVFFGACILDPKGKPARLPRDHLLAASNVTDAESSFVCRMCDVSAAEPVLPPATAAKAVERRGRPNEGKTEARKKEAEARRVAKQEAREEKARQVAAEKERKKAAQAAKVAVRSPPSSATHRLSPTAPVAHPRSAPVASTGPLPKPRPMAQTAPAPPPPTDSAFSPPNYAETSGGWAPPLDRPPPQDFRSSYGPAPTVAEVLGARPNILFSLKPIARVLQVDATSPQTVSNGNNLLNHLLDSYNYAIQLNPRWKSAPLVEVLIEFLEHRARVRQWKHQTKFRQACALHGVFSNLPLYSNFPTPVLLSQSPVWKQAMAKWRQMSQQSQPHHQAAVTVDDLALAVSSTVDTRIKACLVLQWYLAARVGDILNLRFENIKGDRSSLFLQVTIDHGKVMMKRQPYTVNTYLPLEHYNIVADHINSLQDLRPDSRLFPTHSLSYIQHQQLMRQALRIADPSLNTRAIRRGALQAMAQKGIPPETLMTYSGHTNINTLKRYLDWGRHLGQEITNAKEASTLLAPSPSS